MTTTIDSYIFRDERESVKGSRSWKKRKKKLDDEICASFL